MRNFQGEFNTVKKDILDTVTKQAKAIYIFVERGGFSGVEIRTDIYFTERKVVIFLYTEIDPMSKYFFKFVEEIEREKFWSTTLGRALVDQHNAKLVMVKHEH